MKRGPYKTSGVKKNRPTFKNGYIKKTIIENGITKKYRHNNRPFGMTYHKPLHNRVDGHAVYIYFDPRTKVPFYVGCGEGKRWLTHLHSSHLDTVNKLIEEIRQDGYEPIIGIYSGMTREVGLDFESKLILQYGRIIKNTGTLLNLRARN
jgi:hypothetical protein